MFSQGNASRQKICALLDNYISRNPERGSVSVNVPLCTYDWLYSRLGFTLLQLLV